MVLINLKVVLELSNNNNKVIHTLYREERKAVKNGFIEELV